ncbi:open rectifier potassium channel protein 1 isoform X1 [Diabrotica virgifera virgifera]|uniref:Potassium channel domain-containing protein n=2 Tax=Diabrotica virgifera virgifera TaxID=50390 RepID=A0ABM5ISM3_DIAVI|nr:open rectifier potassium channel protein 1 isoform X1 [Diabrotica virgifera virgifera]
MTTMNKTEWLILFCLFIVYLLFGAFVFYISEHPHELEILRGEVKKRKEIEKLLWNNYHGNNKSMEILFKRLTNYCGKPVHYHMSDELPPSKWNYYNSIFFVITVVSTIGYGNLSPTTMFTRIFMIIYGLIGIPMNGIVMVTLGDFFGKSFTKLYDRWKKVRLEKNTAKLGLIGQIILYAVPGLTFFIFLPATIMSFFENWNYDVSVYYAFVTLTTIGFGDFVAGTENVHQFSKGVFVCYHIFLLVWVIGGLGYVIMIIGFITKGMQSRHIQKLERILAHTVKSTPTKIRNEFRSMLHELLFMRVKPVYKGEFEYTPQYLERSQSCPDFTIWINKNSPTTARKRAMSECYKYNVLERVQSESELDKIDKELTFRPSDALMKQKDLLLKVVDALSLASARDGIISGYSEDENLNNARYDPPPPMLPNQRRRAISDVKPPPKYLTEQSVNTWYGNDASTALKAFNQKKRAMSVAPAPGPDSKNSFLQRVQKTVVNRFRKSNSRENDIEKQNLDESFNRIRHPSIIPSNSDSQRQNMPDQNVLEETSIAEFIRALSAVTESKYKEPPRRKIGLASLTPPRYSPSNPLVPSFSIRRASLIPQTRNRPKPRRFSMTPVSENILSSPPPYSPCVSARNSLTLQETSELRRFSVRKASSSHSSPVRAQVLKSKQTETEKDSKD